MLENPNMLFYLFYKATGALVFAKDYEYVFDLINFELYLDIDFLESFYNLLPRFEHIMDYDMKQNIYNFMNYYRNEYKESEEKVKVYELVNKVIEFTNKCDDIDIEDYIVNDLSARGFDRLYLLNVLSKVSIDDLKGDVKTYNVEDFRVLTVLVNLFSDEEFNLSLDEISSVNCTYMYNVCLMCKEFPQLLSDELVVSRIKKINKLLDNNIKSMDKSDKRFRKISIHEYKKYQKTIRGI